MKKETENLIIKFLTKEANLDELRRLELWISNPKNEILFFEFIKTNALVNITVSKYNKEAKKNIKRRINQEKNTLHRKSKISFFVKYAAAAIVIGILTMTYFARNSLFNNLKNQTPAPIIVNTNTIVPGNDKATLTLEDGSVVLLGEGNSFQAKNASSNGEKIIYQASKQNSAEIEYNYLTIPRGGQFHIVLSDDTEVWLNSESQLKYPVNFREGDTRNVELVYGEAYFDVSPSSQHNGAKFKVFNKSQEIVVLGTEFNIKAYRDEFIIYTTLVEGKVEINIEDRKENLISNQQLKLDIKTDVSIIKTVDTYNETSWKDGVFSFEEKTLREMMLVLSRWYDIEIIFKNESIEEEVFVGILRKNQNITEILTSIKNFGIIKNFEINDKKVILK